MKERPIATLHWIEDGEEYSMEFYKLQGEMGLIEMQEYVKKEGYVSWTCWTSMKTKVV